MIRRLKALLSRRDTAPAPTPHTVPVPALAEKNNALSHVNATDLGRMWMDEEITPQEYTAELMRRRKASHRPTR